jgi:hypothetical protein
MKARDNEQEQKQAQDSRQRMHKWGKGYQHDKTWIVKGQGHSKGQGEKHV